MRLSNITLSIVLILLLVQSCCCQPEDFYDQILQSHTVEPVNDTLTLDDIFTEDSMNINGGTPRTVSAYPLAVDVRTKYVTDEEDYTSNESIAFSIHTNQQRLQSITVLAGFAYENINYAFNIENGRLSVIFSQEKLPDLILTSKNDSQWISNEQWHRIRVERSDRKLRFVLDDIEQSNATLDDEWPAKTNVFIGSELTPVPNADYDGTIADIIVNNAGRSLTLREEDLSDADFKDAIIPPLKNQSEALQTIAFLPNDNNEILLRIPVNSSLKTLSFSFRTQSNASTLLHFDEFDLNIASDGYLTLAARDSPAQRVFSSVDQKPINHGQLHLVDLELNNQTMDVWMNGTRKTSVALSSSSLLASDLIFGWHNQFLGCIENITYNRQLLSLKDVPLSRQRCLPDNIILKSFHEIYIDQIISFEEHDRPLIIVLDQPEKFSTLSLSFYTQEFEGIICSLADKTYENILILSLRRERLFVTYQNRYHGRIEISLNNTLDGQVEHDVLLRLISKDTLLLQFDDDSITKKIPDAFYVDTIYMGKLDGFVTERYGDLAREDFLGCMRDITLNDKPLIKLEHIHRSNRLGNTCRLAKRGRKNVVSYMSSAISFSIRDEHDIIELEIPVNEQFYHCQLSIRTRSSDGTILSMYSDEDYGFVLFLKNGKLHWKYHSLDNSISEVLFEDDRAMNDGQQHDIFISRQISKLTLYKNMYIEIDQRGSQISFPSSSLLFFDVLTVGGSHRDASSNLLVGCFANLTYNHQPLLPEGIVKFDRYDCFYEHDSICDKQIPCYHNQPLQFCGQMDCSVVCSPATADVNKKGLLRYFSDIEPGEYEQIYLTIFTTAGNSTLYVTQNGSIQVSIILQDYYPRLIIQNGGIIYTYDFPGRVRNDQWHLLQCQKTLNTIDLTFDEETRHYTNFTEHFTLFADNLIHICGGNFNGYIQDIILTADNHYENLVQNSIHNPGLIDYDQSVTWNNRANIPECKFDHDVEVDVRWLEALLHSFFFSSDIFAQVI